MWRRGASGPRAPRRGGLVGWGGRRGVQRRPGGGFLENLPPPGLQTQLRTPERARAHYLEPPFPLICKAEHIPGGWKKRRLFPGRARNGTVNHGRKETLATGSGPAGSGGFTALGPSAPSARAVVDGVGARCRLPSLLLRGVIRHLKPLRPFLVPRWGAFLRDGEFGTSSDTQT